MKDELITFETAKLAKEKGFDIKCKHWYDQIEVLNPRTGAGGAMCYDNVGYAPTQSLLQKWLREVHNFQVSITPYHCINEELPYGLSIDYPQLPTGKWGYIEYQGADSYKTYEEALEVGLYESLKHIK